MTDTIVVAIISGVCVVASALITGAISKNQFSMELDKKIAVMQRVTAPIPTPRRAHLIPWQATAMQGYFAMIMRIKTPFTALITTATITEKRGIKTNISCLLFIPKTPSFRQR